MHVQLNKSGQGFEEVCLLLLSAFFFFSVLFLHKPLLLISTTATHVRMTNKQSINKQTNKQAVEMLVSGELLARQSYADAFWRREHGLRKLTKELDATIKNIEVCAPNHFY